MASSKQFAGRPLKRPTEFKQWLFATAFMSRDELIRCLSEPHYIENDPRSTAGGSEDHWAFSFDDGMCIGILYRRPYQEVSFFADPPDIRRALKKLDPLIVGHDIRIADKPILML